MCGRILPLCLVTVLCLSVAQPLFAQPLFAQSVLDDRPHVSHSGSDYQRAVRFRGIDTDATYYDPLEPLPPLKVDERLGRPATQDGPDGTPRGEAAADWTAERGVIAAVAAAILFALAYLVLRHGGSLAVSLKREAANPARTSGAARAQGGLPDEAVPDSLEEVLRIGDRQRALIVLARSALARVLGAHGVLLQKSWTARDALRHIPAGQEHVAGLRRLILASERVHFGGRTVSEGEFDEIVAEVRPLFGASGG